MIAEFIEKNEVIMKVRLYRRINAAFWLILAVVIMLAVAKEWSEYGEYTFLSFLASLTIHGGFCVLFLMVIDEYLKKIEK